MTERGLQIIPAYYNLVSGKVDFFKGQGAETLAQRQGGIKKWKTERTSIRKVDEAN
jgi:hypothetical protein